MNSSLVETWKTRLRAPQNLPNYYTLNHSTSMALLACYVKVYVTTIFITTRLFFSKHLWALCNTLPSIIPYMGSVWCYRNWIELVGIKMTPNYPVNLRWWVIYWLVRDFRVVDVARILHVWQTFVKKIRHFLRIKYPLGGLPYAADGKLAFNFVNKLNWSVK